MKEHHSSGQRFLGGVTLSLTAIGQIAVSFPRLCGDRFSIVERTVAVSANSNNSAMVGIATVLWIGGLVELLTTRRGGRVLISSVCAAGSQLARGVGVGASGAWVGARREKENRKTEW